jgi:hypothetical protein
MPELYDSDEMELYENGFISMDWFTDWGIGPGTTEFWQAAGELGKEAVFFNEGEHPGAHSVVAPICQRVRPTAGQGPGSDLALSGRRHCSEDVGAEPGGAQGIEHVPRPTVALT